VNQVVAYCTLAAEFVAHWQKTVPKIQCNTLTSMCGSQSSSAINNRHRRRSQAAAIVDMTADASENIGGIDVDMEQQQRLWNSSVASSARSSETSSSSKREKSVLSNGEVDKCAVSSH
jgi:hypothetical protein